MSEGLTFTRTQMAALLGVTMPTIKTAIDENAPGVEQSGGRGKSAKINGPVFIAWWIERALRKATAEKPKESKPYEREMEVDIALKELKLAKERELVAPVTTVAAEVRNLVANLTGGVRAMPRREAHRVMHLTETVDAVEALTAIGEALLDDIRISERWTDGEESSGEGAPAE